MEFKPVGTRIKQKRLEKSWSQEDFAEKVNLSAVYIGMIERGEKTPKLETFIRIVNTLNVTADELLVDVCFLQALFGQSCKTFLDIVACPNWTKLQSIWLALNRPAEQPCRHYELFTIRGTETVVLSLYPHVHVF